MLVEGYDREPMILKPGRSPTTRALLRGRGADQGDGPAHVGAVRRPSRERATRRSGEMAEEVETKHGIDRAAACASATCGPRSTRFLEVYNEAWERNWGFVPLTEEEVRHYAKELKPILDENWAFIAEKRRRDRRRRAHAARLQPGAQAHQRPAAADRLGEGAVLARARSTASACSRSASRPSTSTPAWPRALHRALRLGRAHAPEGRRDGLDPGDQQGDEPGHGGHGGQGSSARTGSSRRSSA